jgi:hypothetical protein
VFQVSLVVARALVRRRQTGAEHVDAINTFGVSAGRFAYIRGVSRRQIPCFRTSEHPSWSKVETRQT